MNTIYLIKEGKMSADGISSIWGSVLEGYFETVFEAEKYLSDNGYEHDYDDVYFVYDDEKSVTKIAEIISFDKIIVENMLITG